MFFEQTENSPKGGTMNRKLLRRWIPITFVFAALLFLAGCKDDATITNPRPPDVDMNFPESLTGAETSPAALTAPAAIRIANDTDTRSVHGKPHCIFEGEGANDPFQNGYLMTRFLVSTVASWMCVTDFLVNEVAAFNFPTDGSIFAIAPNPSDPGAPTGISITLDSATQSTTRLYFNSDTTTPGLYVSWNTNGGTTQGKLVLADGLINDLSSVDLNEPDGMRLDFTFTTTSQVADMFISFPPSHPNVNRFRIMVTRDLNTANLPIFTALGRLEANKQFDPRYVAGVSGPTLPSLLMYTVSDANGNGAAIASFTDVGFTLDLTGFILGHFGHYLFSKVDKYFFNDLLAAEWVVKDFTTAILQDITNPPRNASVGNETTVEGILTGISPGYFASNCRTNGANCQALFDALFDQDNYGQEANTGTDPGDWRSAIIAGVEANGTADYLQSICPGDAASCAFNVTDVFAQSFTPTN